MARMHALWRTQSNDAIAQESAAITAPAKSIVVVGHVNHGKSTLVGRLLHDTGTLPQGRVEAVRAMSEKRGMPFEWAFLLDALQAERDQGITIDVSQIFFRTSLRNYVLIDAPGHREFVKNMITGATQADAAVLVVDAREGMQEQTRRHAYLLHLLGIHQIVVAINKMDMVDYSEARFHEVSTAVRDYLADLGIDLQHTLMIPVVGRDGDNIVASSGHMPWYDGPTLAGSLDILQPPVTSLELPLRFPVQDVYKFDDRRIIAGRIESGHLRKGDTLVFSPSNKKARISSIEAWNAKEPVMAVRAGQSIGVTLDEQIFVERGEICSLETNPPMLSNVFRGRIFWLGKEPLLRGARYKMKLCTGEYQVEVEKIERVIDVQDLGSNEQNHVERNAIAEVVFRSRRTMALDPFDHNMYTGRFVLVKNYDIVGGGLINMDGYTDQRHQGIKSTNIFRVEHRVPIEERWKANGHKSGILWMTGLSGAGKSTLAFSLEQHLFRKGYVVYVLDGDNVRHGLCSDLGFSPQDRVENIRRVGHAAGLFARAGFLVITAFISPYRADRDRVRAIAPEIFHEIHIDADLRTCEQRDPKGLYKKARRGEISDFTGISAPYEPPTFPELRIDTGGRTLDECVSLLDSYVHNHFALMRDRPVESVASHPSLLQESNTPHALLGQILSIKISGASSFNDILPVAHANMMNKLIDNAAHLDGDIIHRSAYARSVCKLFLDRKNDLTLCVSTLLTLSHVIGARGEYSAAMGILKTILVVAQKSEMRSAYLAISYELSSMSFRASLNDQAWSHWLSCLDASLRDGNKEMCRKVLSLGGYRI